MLEFVKRSIRKWSDWQDALAWAKITHPSWAQLATQIKRPEIRETYRKKIVREYCERCW